MTDTSGIDYFLHVDLVVKETDVVTFEELVTEFLNKGGFQRIVRDGDDLALRKLDTKRLVLALKGVKSFEYAAGISLPSVVLPEPRQGRKEKVFRYVHLWSVPDVRELDLARLMRLCAADSLYQKLDARVVEESQDFVVRVDLPEAKKEYRNFIRSIRRFQSFDLGTYLFNAGVLLKTLEANKVLLMGDFQTVTGTINSVVEFWNTDASDPDIVAVEAKKSGLPAEFVSTFVPSPGGSEVATFSEVLQSYLNRDKLKEAMANDQLEYLRS